MRIEKIRRNFLYFIAVAIIITLTFSSLNAEPSGYSGRTSTSTSGCGDCHGVNPTVGTTVSIEDVSGAISLSPGEKRQFTIVVAHATQKVAGVGIAVRTTPTGSASAGTLSVQTGSGLRLRGTEITHSSPRAMSGGKVSLTFSWTAPQTPGTYYMQAIGNAANGNGSDDAGDSWNWMPPIEINVGTTSVALQSEADDLQIGHTTMYIHDLNGNIVQRTDFEVTSAGQPLPPAPSLPNGVYGLTLINAGHVKRSIIVID